jgi:2',3'-cyclic-nucleotide 2'-phosphodiesterase (5'-nucleotidase family)
MLSRKKFIRQAVLSSGAILAGSSIASAADYINPQRLTILHTNDTHSWNPFRWMGAATRAWAALQAGLN